jgi:DNA modification methylase
VSYGDFLASKVPSDPATGLSVVPDLPDALFPFQRDLTTWALRRGRAAIFADTGLGKTAMQLAWADAVARHCQRPVLLLAPLAVAHQTVREAEKFGILAEYARKQCDTAAPIVVTNYERMENFDPSAFVGIVLDESSILKSYDGATRTALIESFGQTPFRLACTATPAPNDFMELGNHAEFLGVMTRQEMLSMFFVHDGGETQQWRLKGHAESEFWKWMCSWSAMMRRPSDLGYSYDGFALPPLRVHSQVVETGPSEGALIALEAATLQERIVARRSSVADRVEACAKMVKATGGTWIVWCHLNSESQALTQAIPGAVEVTGSMSPDEKERALLAFSRGEIQTLVTKPSIAGFGLNWQHCHQMAFVGLSDSWEEYYQAVRRCWRFGQRYPVDVHVISADTEGAVVSNIRRKESDAARMADAMVAHMKDTTSALLHGTQRQQMTYERAMSEGKNWRMHLGDCVEVTREMPDESVDFSIFSPPFASLYTYTNSERDMGNCRDHAEFFEHFAFLIAELSRITKAGRLCSVHCMNLPTSKVRDGVIGLSDFRGEIIRQFERAGWVYHSEVCIWKDPVTAMQRTKALGLLHKTIRKDSSMSRQGIPDYLVTFRKPGENAEPIAHTAEEFPVSLWQRYASPIWMDINPSDTLQYRSAREQADEKHICPLQLEVIRRALLLWTNPGDLVLSPFAGIGSEGHVAIEEGRRFLGVELKRSYWKQACANLAQAHDRRTADLFAELPA